MCWQGAFFWVVTKSNLINHYIKFFFKCGGLCFSGTYLLVYFAKLSTTWNTLPFTFRKDSSHFIMYNYPRSEIILHIWLWKVLMRYIILGCDKIESNQSLALTLLFSLHVLPSNGVWLDKTSGTHFVQVLLNALSTTLVSNTLLASCNSNVFLCFCVFGRFIYWIKMILFNWTRVSARWGNSDGECHLVYESIHVFLADPNHCQCGGTRVWLDQTIFFVLWLSVILTPIKWFFNHEQ